MFKKLFISFLAVTLIFCVFNIGSKPVFAEITDSFNGYEIYTANYSSTEKVVTLSAKKDYYTVAKKCGESCRVREDVDKDSVFKALNATLVFCEETENGINYYGYSRNIKYKTEINGKTVNLQVFVCKDYVKVGAPIIFGSF